MSRTRLCPAFLALALVVGSGPLGCSEHVHERLREHTYPPSFKYIPEERLRSTMWNLAYHVAQLDQRMRDPKVGGESLQLEVIRELDEIQRAAAGLGHGDRPSNHPQVSRNIDAFRDDLYAARRAAAAQPPNYFLAGSIAGACTNCHLAE
jgi:hypothetical protein